MSMTVRLVVRLVVRVGASGIGAGAGTEPAASVGSPGGGAIAIDARSYGTHHRRRVHTLDQWMVKPRRWHRGEAATP